MTRTKIMQTVEVNLKPAATIASKVFREVPPPLVLALSLIGLGAAPLFAQGSPWENAVTVLQASFTGVIARGLSLVSIVVGGLMFAFDEGGSKKMLAGIIFGVGMAIGAVNFLAWLFP